MALTLFRAPHLCSTLSKCWSRISWKPLCTLNVCIDRCSGSAWHGPVVNYRFCQVAFHTLFYADYYLGADAASFRDQLFHRDHAKFFGDYEEFEDRVPVMLYDKAEVQVYLEYCRGKAAAALAAETEGIFESTGRVSPSPVFPRRVIRLQHPAHSAPHRELGMRLRIDSNEDIPWIASGWSAV